MRLYDYPASPNCYKVRLALAELGIEYERVTVDIFGGDTLTEEYGVINAARDTPVLELDDGERLVESNAILLFLAGGTELLPGDEVERAQVHRWMFYEQARIVPSIGALRLRLARTELDPSDEGVRRQRRMCVAAATLVDQHLQDREFLVGDRYSVADLCLYGYLHAAGDAGVDTARLPALHAWLGRVRARPRHTADLAPLPDNVRIGHGQSIYDFVGI
jgi:glutathione S-transferase